MSISEEPVECPLCMEPLEIDDISFYPCTCGYQICRFCWHRIRTDENGLCPACRKQYPEDPAEFKPLTEDELARIKKERRQKDNQRKQKAAENRKHLANVRVVQKNLVFVVGLTPRLADADVLKKHEYFGKFGKIHKVVINQSTTYAGSQGPSSSAYLTYHRSEDALRAIQAVNNAYVDGRTLKASLGTTKYCSHFLKGTQCQKTDCMYLHELGETSASFTKEEMQQGKHQEYEQKLIEDFLNHQNAMLHSSKPPGQSQTQNNARQRKRSSPPTIPLSVSPNTGGGSGGVTSTSTSTSHTTAAAAVVNSCRESWPSLPQTTAVAPPSQQQQTQQQNTNSSQSGTALGVRTDWSHTNGDQSKASPPLLYTAITSQQTSSNHRKNSDTALHSPGVDDRCSPASNSSHSSASSTPAPPPVSNAQNLPQPAPAPSSSLTNNGTQKSTISQKPPSGGSPLIPGSGSQAHTVIQTGPYSLQLGANNKPVFHIAADNNLSLFSDNGFARDRQQRKQNIPPLLPTDDVQRTEVPDQIPASTHTDWQAAFGFPSSSTTSSQPSIDDDLGFDPWDESTKALADLIQYEKLSPPNQRLGPPPRGLTHMQAPPPPPGFQTQQHFAPKTDFGALQQSKMAFMAGFNQAQQQSAVRPPGFMGGVGSAPKPPYMTQTSADANGQPSRQNEDLFNMREWQEGLRALLPNINISFGSSPYPVNNNNNQPHPQQQQQVPRSNSQPITGHHKGWPPMTPPKNSWTNQDPAILTSGYRSSANGMSESPPHWMRSLQQLTELDGTSHTQTQSHNRLPFVHNFSNTSMWPPSNQVQPPPPGFHQPHIQPEPHMAADYQ